MTDVKVITPTDLDGVTVKLNPQGKVEARATCHCPSEVIDVLSLDWQAQQGSGLHLAKWTFQNTYKFPFLSQVVTAATAPTGTNIRLPVVYFYDLKSNEVSLAIAAGMLTALQAKTRKLEVMVEDVGDVTATNSSSDAQITEQQFNTYLIQNLEVVEQVSNFHDGQGNSIDSPFGISIAGQQYMIDRVGRVKGTNWLVLGSSTMT